jgi:4-amino-4-deoxy-L-arabinose transferase-like glycosyltransferase
MTRAPVRGRDVTISVVVPAHDEAPNLERLLREVHAALDPGGLAWELIVVDDGSTDETGAVLGRLAVADPRLRVLRLPRRCGQTAALRAGFGAASGAVIATLDADLQCPPAELPALLAALDGADLACGVRAGRRDPLTRRIASGLSNLARRCFLAPRLRDLACPLRAFRADALARLEAEMPLFDGAHRWLPALFTLAGLRVVQRPVVHQERAAGVSKYSTAGRAGPIARELVHVLGLAWPRSRGLRCAATLAGLALVALPYLYALGAWPLIEPDEGRNAEVAREMLELGTWSVPHFNHLPYLDKPVLLFWAIAAAFRMLGVTEFAARLPSALAAVATVALTFVLGRTLLGPRRAAIAAVAVATAPLVMVFARLAIFDMLLTALVTAALLCLLEARRTGDAWRWWPLAGLAMGLAVLCKGPVGVAVPLLAWMAGRGALPPAPRRAGAAAAIAAVGLFAAIVLPWLARVHAIEPAFLRYALFDETLDRFTSVERFHRGGPPYYYAVVLAWAGGVWGPLLVAVVPVLWRRWRAGDPDAATIAFATRAALAIVLLFTCSASKLPQYVLPALVPLALLVAIGVAAAPARLVGVLRGLAVAAVVAGVAATAVGLLGFTPGRNDFGYVTPAVVATTGLCLAAWGIVTAVVGRRPAAALVCAALVTPMLGLMLLEPLGAPVAARSSRDLAAQVPPDAKVVCAMEFRTSLPFYLRRPVLLVSDDGHELTSNYVVAMQQRFMGGAYLQPATRLVDAIADDAPVLVLVTRWREDELHQLTRPRRLVPLYADRHSMLLRPAG